MKRTKRVFVALWIIFGIVAASIILFYGGSGWTSGAVRLYVDGNEVVLNEIPVEFRYNRVGEMGNLKNSILKGGKFDFKRNIFFDSSIKFSLDPNIWGDDGEPIDFKIVFIHDWEWQNTKFDITINITTDEIKYVELTAQVKSISVSSGMIPIDPSGMEVYVYLQR